MDQLSDPPLQPLKTIAASLISDLRANATLLTLTNIWQKTHVISNVLLEVLEDDTHFFLKTIQSHLSTLTADLDSVDTSSCPHQRALQTTVRPLLASLQSIVDEMIHLQSMSAGKTMTD